MQYPKFQIPYYPLKHIRRRSEKTLAVQRLLHQRAAFRARTIIANAEQIILTCNTWDMKKRVSLLRVATYEMSLLGHATALLVLRDAVRFGYM